MGITQPKYSKTTMITTHPSHLNSEFAISEQHHIYVIKILPTVIHPSTYFGISPLCHSLRIVSVETVTKKFKALHLVPLR